jgi:flagellar protein FlbD
MIPVHRLTHPENPIHVNPDLIQTIESTPDTVVTMTNHAKCAAEISDLICAWRASIVTRGLGIPELTAPELAQVLPFSPRGD